jgi:hypothetical protein
MPTGYVASERHPTLLKDTEIIRSGRELEQRMVAAHSLIAGFLTVHNNGRSLGGRPLECGASKTALIRGEADQRTNSIQRSPQNIGSRRITSDHVRTICSMFSLFLVGKAGFELAISRSRIRRDTSCATSRDTSTLGILSDPGDRLFPNRATVGQFAQ